jgi:hypothetical protein
MVVAMCIDSAIFFASGRGAHHEVAVLVGATNRIHEELGSVREDFEQSMVLRDTKTSRAALGETAFTADVAAAKRCPSRMRQTLHCALLSICDDPPTTKECPSGV